MKKLAAITLTSMMLFLATAMVVVQFQCRG